LSSNSGPTDPDLHSLQVDEDLEIQEKERALSALSLLTRDDLQRIADIAAIPTDPAAHRDWFFRAVDNLLFDAWEDSASNKRHLAARRDAKLTNTLRALNLTRRLLSDIGVPPTALEHLDFFYHWLGLPSPSSSARRARGRPSGSPANAAFLKFVRRLLIDVGWAGGRLTLEKNIGRGSLSDIIDELAAFLPEDFVPRPLPTSTLQRLKTSVRRTRADVHPNPATGPKRQD